MTNRYLQKQLEELEVDIKFYQELILFATTDEARSSLTRHTKNLQLRLNIVKNYRDKNRRFYFAATKSSRRSATKRS